MKILRRSLQKDGSGEITLIPETPEDLWHAYHLIGPGDQVKATTFRKVQKESATGSVDTEKVKLTLTIRVEKVEFNPQAGQLRINGPNISENKFLGQYHTLELELHRKFSLAKECWDAVALDRVDKAADPTQTADVAAVLITDGLANIWLVSNGMTILRAKVETAIPRKRKDISASSHDKALSRFYESVMRAIVQNINFDVVKCVLVGGPGFTKDAFLTWLFAEAVRLSGTGGADGATARKLLDNRGKFLPCHATSAFKEGLKELLTDPALAPRLADTKAAAEVRALTDFYEMLKTDPNRAFYGYRHVARAAEQRAVDCLLVTDELFRAADIATRKRYVQLVEDVRASGGSVYIFSGLHVSGEQLGKLSGVAAILRFPLPDIDDEDVDEDEADGSGDRRDDEEEEEREK